MKTIAPASFRWKDAPMGRNNSGSNIGRLIKVRASVRNFDVDMPANTIRAWTIGMLLCTIGSAINMLLSLRNPSISLTTFVIQLIAYPLGLLWDLVFPDRVFNVWGLKFNLRPGPFNFKEHVIIVVMSNVGWLEVAAVRLRWRLTCNIFPGCVWRRRSVCNRRDHRTADVVQAIVWVGVAAAVRYHHALHGLRVGRTGKEIPGLARRHDLADRSRQLCPLLHPPRSFSFGSDKDERLEHQSLQVVHAGVRRVVLVVLVSGIPLPGPVVVLLDYLDLARQRHRQPAIRGLQWLRAVPDYLGEEAKSWAGYSAANVPAQDWSIISGYLMSPLIPPFHAIANVLGGVTIFFVFVSLGIHYSGMWYSAYLPVQNSHAYDNTGHLYNVSAILGDDLQFDEAKYKAYSPLYLPTQFALAYGLSFAAVAAVITHVACYHGREIWTQWKLARSQEDDVHMRLMKKYRDAPDWWYIVLFVIMLGLSFAVVCAWDTNFPWWAYVICMLIPLFWTVPIGIVQAITNIQLGLNVLTEFIIGYMLPGRPLAMMMFKNYGYLCMSQALYFIQDLKLGHYMKVPPRVMFWSQLIASIWSAIVQIAVMNWALATIPDICSETQVHQWNCPSARVFYTASIVWGAIGPARMFSGDALYSALQWFWLVGAAAPVLTWFLARRYPRSFWRYVNMPLIFGGSGWLPPATVFIYYCWGIVGTVFNYFIRRRRTGWWLQYNYVTSSALDCGLIVSTLVIFFALYLSGTGSPRWFGNMVPFKTMDMLSKAVQRPVPPGETFGPSSWP